MHYHDLLRKMQDQPFKPFRMRLLNNTVYDSAEPWMLIPGDTSAVVATRTHKDDRGFEYAEDWRTVAIDHITEFSDLPPAKQARRRESA